MPASTILFPAGAVVYLVGTTEGSFAEWLEVHKTSTSLKVAYGTIWPRPDCYHVSLESALLEEAAGLIKRVGIALPCIHLHVHDACSLSGTTRLVTSQCI